MELTEAVELFLLSKTAEERREATLQWYALHLGKFCRWAKLQPSAELSPVLIERYLSYRRGQGLQPETVAGTYRALNVFFNWLVARGYIECSPTAPLRKPQVPDRRPRFTSSDECTRLISSIQADGWIDFRDQAIIAVLFFTGMRVGDLVKLRLRDIDQKRNVIWLYDRKANEDNFVPMLPELWEHLAIYDENRPEWHDDHLFLSCDGWRGPNGHLGSTGVRFMLRRRCLAAGMETVTPHMFRHGLAMHLTEIGADSRLIQLILGHKDRRSTERYSRWNTSTVVNRFFEVMGQA